MKALYLRWLRAAFLYYLRPGDDTGMGDHEWDAAARLLYSKREELGREEYPVLFSEGWSGGSLYFLRTSDYPEEVRQ